MVPVPNTLHADVRVEIASLGILQGDDPFLRRKTRRVALPREITATKAILQQLEETITHLRRIHRFTNGVGLAAPQIGCSRSVALVRPPGNYPIRLINPRIVSQSRQTALQYEGCLSFFDYRGLVPRPISIAVENADLRGRRTTRTYTGPVARLIAHEIDHLHGKLYVDLLTTDADLIDITVYKSQRWR